MEVTVTEFEGWPKSLLNGKRLGDLSEDELGAFLKEMARTADEEREAAARIEKRRSRLQWVLVALTVIFGFTVLPWQKALIPPLVGMSSWLLSGLCLRWYFRRLRAQILPRAANENRA